ncbi:hypothetical protein [Legionella yabuuchiae]|uniref:hypothetical protein n=1 Tax=Legionella yabuuchiae TaxID=376727 RepID=UPI0010560EA0|nr:hypothetical protein [Legionella yabuuchiae]
MNKDTDKLESVKRAFQHWRKTKKKQGKVPDYLWKQVKGLIGSLFLRSQWPFFRNPYASLWQSHIKL